MKCRGRPKPTLSVEIDGRRIPRPLRYTRNIGGTDPLAVIGRNPEID